MASEVTSPLFRLLGAAATQDLRSSGSDWEEVIRSAAAESVLSSLYDCIQALPAPPDVPEEIANVFSSIRELNRERNEKILANVREIACALNCAGIEPIALKGVAQ